jgi:hypothetical protein
MPTFSAVQSSCAFASPDPLDQAIQQELAALAAAAATHRSACRWLDEWSGPEGVKEHVAHRIEARHRREQEPHLLRLAELHQHRMATVVSIAAACRRRKQPIKSGLAAQRFTASLPSSRTPLRPPLSVQSCRDSHAPPTRTMA